MKNSCAGLIAVTSAKARLAHGFSNRLLSSNFFLMFYGEEKVVLSCSFLNSSWRVRKKQEESQGTSAKLGVCLVRVFVLCGCALHHQGP